MNDPKRIDGAAEAAQTESGQEVFLCAATPAQQRLWLLCGLGEDAANYVIAGALRLQGALDPARLEAALNDCLARHESLRTGFAEIDGVPQQAIEPQAALALPLTELDALPAEARLEAALATAGALARQPFDLARPPLLRARLFRLGADDWLLALAIHHIVCDGPSLGILIADLAAAYAGRGQGRPLPAAPALQFADFAEWQQEQLARPETERLLAAAAARLAGVPDLLVPTDRPRPALRAGRGARHAFALDAVLMDAVTLRARALGSTPFAVLLAAWGIVLAGWSGQDDFAIGTPVSGRADPALAEVVGLFAETAALRFRCDGEPTVGEVLRRVRDGWRDTLAEAGLPFDRLVQRLRRPQDRSRTPLLQTLFSLNPAAPPLALDGLSATALPLRGGEAKTELVLELSETAAGCAATLDYDAALFDAATIAWLAERYRAVLAAAATRPEQALRALTESLPARPAAPLDAAQRALLRGFNATAQAVEPGQLLHRAFEAQAARTPDAPAVRYQGETLSYGELNRRANQLAHHLRALGVRPDDRVALCCERGCVQLVGLWAVLKAGGAYVPLDPAHPAERLAYLLGDSGAVALLTEEALLPRFDAGPSPRICLDAPATLALLDGLPGHDPDADEIGLTDRHLAYVIYTSGSTGQPKGVMVEHRSLANLRAALAPLCAGLPEGARIGLNAALAFDASLQSLLQLLDGHCLLPIPPQLRGDGAALLDFLQAERIDGFDCTPAVMDLLIAAGFATTSRYRPTWVLLGGEAISPRSWQILRSGDAVTRRATRIHNVYGPTECTVDATGCELFEAGDAPVIGRPLANTRVHVVDPAGRLLPPGEIGELWIGGAGVARGYLGRPELDAERFGADPFAEEEGARLYRSGDLGRWRADGLLEYHGRADFQLKIRGHRIEPGEIEAQLRRCDGVDEALVMAREDQPGERRLVAYLRLRPGAAAPDPAALRHRLAATLAEPMLPAAYVCLDAFPLTPNGKVDRRALPAPGSEALASAAYAAPEGEVEQAIAALWQALLGVERVGRHDDFFALGGHSLLATRAAARLGRRFGLRLPMAALFDAPVLAALAARIEAARMAETAAAVDTESAAAGSASADRSPTDRGPAEAAGAAIAADGGPAPLSASQLGLWFVQQLDPASTAYVLSGAIRIDGALSRSLLSRTLDLLQARHHALRTRFDAAGGVPSQTVLAPSGIALPIDDLSRLAPAMREAELQRRLDAEARRPFELPGPPPVRARLLVLGPDCHVLSLSLHHIVADGWSLGLVWRDLVQGYRALREGGAPDWTPLPQYADYARGEAARLAAPAAAAELDYWRRALDALPPLELPTDFARPPLPGYRGAQYRFTVPARLCGSADRLARAAGASRFMVLLAAFQALLARWSGQRDFAVGVPVSGREALDWQETVGCFVNTVAIRAELGDSPDFRTLVERVKTRSLDAFAHAALPFEHLVERLRPAHDAARQPLFQALFNYQRTDYHRHDWADLAVTPLEIDGGAAQFDLGLYLEDAPGGLAARLVYRSELFLPATAERMAAAFLHLLEDAAEPARQPLRTAILRDADREALAAWNDTAADFGPAATIDELIAAQAARTPAAPAIEADDGRLDYAGLLARADALAARLQALGAGPGRVVAVHLPRGVDLPVALLAVHRAGAAYLPLDPDLPGERLAYMVEDAAPVALIARPGSAGWLAAPLPQLAPAEAGEAPAAFAPPPRSADDLAYLIYTSGSTGRPKGVMVAHRGVVNRLRWGQATFALGAGDKVLQKTSAGFDVSVWEFFWPLSAGATLVMARPGGQREPDYLAALIERAGITCIHFVPSMLAAFLAVADTARCGALRYVFASGEALTPELRDRFLDLGLPARLHDLYGPTEASIEVTWRPCEAADRGKPQPIGRPIANCRIHVLDALGQELPIGVPGEICIAGVQVAQGYLNRPELSAERFVADPFVAGGRLYRTGDVGRWCDGGWVEYLGRRDGQIKLRGQRIELGEIEAALRRQPGVLDAVVLVEGEREASRLVGFVLAGPGAAPDAAALRGRLAAELPEAMVPALLQVRDAFPLSSAGKTDRQALLAQLPRAEAAAGPAPAGALERRIAAIWCEVLGLPAVDAARNFFEAGGNSLLLMQVHARLKQAFSPAPRLADLFRFPSVAALAAFLGREQAPAAAAEAAAGTAAAPAAADEPIAVVGMAGRFPGAADVEALWQLLLEGRSGVREIGRDEALADGADPALLDHPGYVPFAGTLDGIDAFDERLFGYSPADAALIDPQGRIFLECAHEALASAGIDPARCGGRIGVYAGASVSSYALAALRGPALADTELFRALFANDKDYLASRVAYKLGLKGPAVGVQTACSTSLVAVAMAVRALRSGECDAVLAGGASVSVPQRVGYLYEDGSILSPDGRCRAFGIDAAGTVPGNGVGVVVLKRLSRALADGDPIRAVIRAVALNNDGADKVGFSAPSVGGQEEVLQAALREAGLDAADIGYVETHGTGTRLGDEVELSALAGAFGGAGQGARCLIGSLKSNLGHLDAAAGVAGLIKAVLTVERGIVPASLHVEQPNALLAAGGSRFALATATVAWPDDGRPRRAGVSSFGIGGTNAHCIVEQPPRPAGPERQASEPREQLLLLSALDAAALERQRSRLAAALADDADLAAVAWTLQRGRQILPLRLAVTARTAAEARSALLAAPLPAAAAPAEAPALYFAFPGQGSQRAGMGHAIYAAEPAFRALADACLALLPAELAAQVRLAAFADPAEAGAEAEALLARTEVAQPALFVHQYALARLLLDWGLRPAGLLGHSLGEIVAAALAGVLTPPDAIQLVVRRARLMQDSAEGAMLQAELPAAELAALLPDGLAIAACNGPALTVAAGPVAQVEAFAAQLDARGVAWQRLRGRHAFHSPAMAPAAAALRPWLATLTAHPPQWPLLSNLDGGWMSDAEAVDPQRWARQLCAPVQFAPALAELAGRPGALLLEIGAGTTLAAFARQAGLAALSLPGRGNLMQAIGALWQAGAAPDWRAMQPAEPPRRVPLPGYPFARNRHWLAPAATPRPAMARPALALLDWRYAEPLHPPAGLAVALHGGEPALREGLAAALAGHGARVLMWDGSLPPPPADRLVVLEPGFDAMLDLAAGLAGRHGGGLRVVTRHAQDAEAATELEAARLAAALASAGQELPELGLRQIDLGGPLSRRQLAALAAECLADGPAGVLLRDGRRRLPAIAELEPAAAAEPWLESQVTLITGGFGRVGQAFARRLAARPGARLVLLGRQVPAGDDPRLLELRALGAEVLALAGDIAADGVAHAAVQAALGRFGRLDCVIHAAGVAGEAAHRPLLECGRAERAAIQAAKLDGTRRLAAALDGVAVRRVLLCSSLSTVLGGLGFAAYAAGNRALEVLAERQSRDGAQWLALGYDGWHFDGDPPATGPALAAAEAIALTERALAAGLAGRVLLSAGRLAERLARWQAVAESAEAAAPAAAATAFVAADHYADPAEAAVAQAIADTLALAAVGPDDDFFALGGDSLVATRVIARLRGATGLPLSVGLVLQAPTVRLLAAAVRAMQGLPAAEASDEYEEGAL